MTDNNHEPLISPAEEASDEEFRTAVDAALDAAAVPAASDATSSDEPLTALDSLQSNEFAIELEGEIVPGIFRVSGLVAYDLGVLSQEQKNITIAKMVQRDASLPFNRWLRETVEGSADGERPTRTLAVVAIDDGDETRRWTLTGANIISVQYSDFDTGSSEFVEEIVTIAYASVTAAWTWSDKQ